MLQSIRNKASSWFMLIILAFALFALAFFGIGDYFTGRVDTHVAKVGDTKVEQREFDQRYQNWRANMRQMMGDNVDPGFLDQPSFRVQILEEMINEAVLQEANRRLGIVVPASQVRSVILEEPAFQVAGQFDPEVYRGWLASQRMSASMFEERVRAQLGTRAMPAAVIGSAIVTDAELDAFLRLSEQTRDARHLRIDSPGEEVSEEVSDEEVQAFYDSHVDEFMTEETVTIEYVEVNAETLDVDYAPSDDELRERYDRERGRFGTPEQRLASHILIRPQGDDADAQRAALEQARELSAKLRDDDDTDFAELAREHSADLGSSGQGGDLGWLERELTEPAFDEKLFEMAAGEISDPVRTDEGYHVIWLREVRDGEEKSFEDVREQLLTEAIQSERLRVYSDRGGQLTDLIYADPSALESAAEQLGLTVQTAGPFTRNSSQGIFATPAVRQAAFSDLVLLEGDVSEAISLSPERMVMLRVVDHQRPEPRPLDSVAANIRSRVVSERRSDAIEARAEALFARLEAGESLDDVAAELELEVDTSNAITRNAAVPESDLVAEIFRMPRPQADAPVRRLLALRDSHVLVELTSVADGDPAAVEQSRRAQVREQLEQGYGRAEQTGLIETLRRGEKVEIASSRAPTVLDD